MPLPRTAGGHLPGGACIPPLLEGWKHKVLLAGKYLNVIRECGMEIDRNNQNGEDLSMSEQKFAFAFALLPIDNSLLLDSMPSSRMPILTPIIPFYNFF